MGQYRACAGIAAEEFLTGTSGETVRALAVAGAGIACLSDFTTMQDRQAGRLVEVLADDTRDVHQPVHAVYYRNSGVSSRIRAYVDFLVADLGGDPMP